jgi:hypothetical protein
MSSSAGKRKGVTSKHNNDAEEEESNHADSHLTTTATMAANTKAKTTTTTAFPTLRIKQLLYRNPKVARIEAGSLELINTTSALFVQKIMNQIPNAQIPTAQTSANTTQDNNDLVGFVVTLQDIRNVIQQDPALSFLQSTVDEMMNNEGADTQRPYAPAKKRPARKPQKPKPVVASTAAAATASNPESVQEAMSMAAKTIAGPTTTTAQEIMEDDDDYD